MALYHPGQFESASTNQSWDILYTSRVTFENSNSNSNQSRIWRRHYRLESAWATVSGIFDLFITGYSCTLLWSSSLSRRRAVLIPLLCETDIWRHLPAPWKRPKLCTQECFENEGNVQKTKLKILLVSSIYLIAAVPSRRQKNENEFTAFTEYIYKIIDKI